MKLYKKMICIGLVLSTSISSQVFATQVDEGHDVIEQSEEIQNQDIEPGLELESGQGIKAEDLIISNQDEIRMEYEEEANVQLVQWEKINLGPIKNTGNTIYYNEQNIPLYEHLNCNYVRVSDLYRFGLAYENGRVVKDDSKDPSVKTEPLGTITSTYLNNDSVWIDNIQTYTLIGDDEIFIPIRALESYFDLNIAEKLSFSDKSKSSSNYITIDEKSITNNLDEVLQIELKNIYYNGEEVVQKEWEIASIEGGATVPLIKENVFSIAGDQGAQMVYVTTLPTKIVSDEQVIYESNYDYGQKNEQIMTYYTKKFERLTNEAVLDELFPPSIVMGTMRYATNGFAAGEKVEVLRAQDGYYYYLNRNGTTVTVPWGSVSIPPNPPVGTNDVTKEEIEAYANAKGFTSKTDYFVWTDLYRQRTYVLKKNGVGEWELIRNMLCSTGKNTNPTPRGNFELTANVPAFGMDKGYMCKNAKQFYGNYLYHSILYDVTGSYLLEGKGVLGQRASQGCIRFSPEDSVWFYQTLPLGTAVYIN